MAKKKVLRYTEEQFITLLENIVNRVKKEQLEESRKNERREKLSENFDRLREMNKNKRRPSNRRTRK